jgi:predicted site-specific integrase-resolvase
VFTIDDLSRRVERLETLAKGLAKEVHQVREAAGPLLYLERRKYLCALQDALFGVESARVVLTQALARLKQDETERAA